MYVHRLVFLTVFLLTLSIKGMENEKEPLERDWEFISNDKTAGEVFEERIKKMRDQIIKNQIKEEPTKFSVNEDGTCTYLICSKDVQRRLIPKNASGSSTRKIRIYCTQKGLHEQLKYYFFLKAKKNIRPEQLKQAKQDAQEGFEKLGVRLIIDDEKKSWKLKRMTDEEQRKKRYNYEQLALDVVYRNWDLEKLYQKILSSSEAAAVIKRKLLKLNEFGLLRLPNLSNFQFDREMEQLKKMLSEGQE